MGNPEYSARTKPIVDKFIEWLNAVKFKNDDECKRVLYEIRDECSNRISMMEEEEAANIDEAETKES